MTMLDKAHAAAAKLNEESDVEEVLEVLQCFQVAAWPDNRRLAPGTIAWLMADFFPRWLKANLT